MNDKQTRYKIEMYILSLALLFILLFILTIEIPIVISIKYIVNNIFSIICSLLFLYCLAISWNFKLIWDGSGDLPIKIKQIEEENYNYLTFLASYIIPFVSMNFSSFRSYLVLIILLISIGIISIRTDNYLANPSLALFKYRLYRVKYEIKGEEYERKVITKDNLNVGDYIEKIDFDENSCYVRRMNR